MCTCLSNVYCLTPLQPFLFWYDLLQAILQLRPSFGEYQQVCHRMLCAMCAIVARHTARNPSVSSFLIHHCSDHSKKPFSRAESFGSICASAMVDANAALVIVITSTGYAARMASKYRPAVPQVVVTADEHVANQVGRSEISRLRACFPD